MRWREVALFASLRTPISAGSGGRMNSFVPCSTPTTRRRADRVDSSPPLKDMTNDEWTPAWLSGTLQDPPPVLSARQEAALWAVEG